MFLVLDWMCPVPLGAGPRELFESCNSDQRGMLLVSERASLHVAVWGRSLLAVIAALLLTSQEPLKQLTQYLHFAEDDL